MNLPQFSLAIQNAAHPGLRSALQQLQPLVEEVLALDRSFADRINASKAARGEGPARLRKGKREEVDGYAKDAQELEEKLTRDFGTMPGETIAWALSAALETDVNFWSGAALKHAHPLDRPVIEETLKPRKELLRRLQALVAQFPPPDDDEADAGLLKHLP